MAEIYLAAGCFWGAEKYFALISGVISTTVGYAAGESTNNYKGKPTYEEVCTGSTGLSETVKVVYNPEKLSLKKILLLFFDVIDPTAVNRQGYDVGTQYRSAIYYTNPADIDIINEVFGIVQATYKKPIVTEMDKLGAFFDAEEYHQKYLDKNPGGYCHIGAAAFDKAKNAN